MNRSVWFGIIVTLVMHGTLAGGVAAFSSFGAADDADDGVKKFLVIEAALAYQSDDATNQPQKPRAKKRSAPVEKAADPKLTANPLDPQAKPPDKPEAAQEDFAKQFEEFRDMRQGQDDGDESDVPDDSTAESAPAGQFDGSKHGFAEVNKGDPYIRELMGAVYKAWSVVSLEKGTDAAVGCVRLAADGAVVDVKLWEATGNTNIDLAATNALEALQKQRKPGEAPVPAYLVRELTMQWTCFKFNIGNQ